MSGSPIAGGAVAIEGNEIVDVGTEFDLTNRYPHAERLDYPHHAILPGLINCHTHLDLTRFQNFNGDPVRKMGGGVVNSIDWLIQCMEYKHKISQSILREAVEEGLEHCIESGTTCVADMGNYEGVFALVEQKGLRGVIFPEVISIGDRVSKDLFESALAIVEKYQELDSDLISVGMGPYSPYTLSRNILRILGQYCRSSQLPLMMHVASSFQEMEFFRDSSGDIADKLFPVVGWDDLPPPHHTTPIQHLLQIGFLDCEPLLVGCTQTTEDDLNIIAQTGSKIVITPRSNHYLQQGQPDLRKIHEKHILTVLGTDGMPSVDSLSLWDEMRAFLENYRTQVTMSGEQVLAMVTSHAARALGLHHEIGTLEKGKKADLLIMDVTSISEQGDLLMNLIRGARDYHIHHVMVNGKTVKSVC